VQRRALIVGGSMSGLLAALMLRRRGWEADIYERVAGELAGRGAGIVAQPSLIAHLKALGLDTSELGVPIARRQMLDREGRVTLTGDCPQILTAWERAVAAALDYERKNCLGMRSTARRAALIIAAAAIVSKCEGRIGAVLLKATGGARTRRADYAMPCRFF